MSTFAAGWSLCGGWAVDAWLGRQTREHGDLDITVFHNDQPALFAHLAGWNLIAHDPNVVGDTTEPWDGRRLDLPAHIHARPGDGQNLEVLNAWVRSPAAQPRDGLNIEFILNERSGRDWILSSDPRLTLPVRRSARRSAWGVPTVVPEVVLFYKAGDSRPRDEADFRALLPHLGEAERHWLRAAIVLAFPGHRWLKELAA